VLPARSSSERQTLPCPPGDGTAACRCAAALTCAPQGVLQYVPGRGEGFPEDFVPFVDMNSAPDAKYK
jgi:hypothetical protein